MFLPTLGSDKNKKIQVLRFGGLDLRDRAAANTLCHSENISSAAYPALMATEPRRKVVDASGISAIALPEYTGEALTSFTGIRNGFFYYCGKKINGGTFSAGQKSIVDFNGKICIFPDKLYYDYLPDVDTGNVSDSLKSMEKSITLSGVRFYSSLDSLTGSYTAYLEKTGGGFDCFSAGDSIRISGCAIKRNNTNFVQSRKDFASDDDIVSAVVKSASAARLELVMYTKSGSKALFQNTTDAGQITVGISIPDMNYVCVHNNRLWGTAVSGEYIYASKPGDCFSFNSFRGLADDSWYSMVGTPGEFTGICSYRASVVAFKRECIHHIYGDSPQNFSMPKQIMGGCADGRSIAELGGVLYYLSPCGFCCYGGGEPYEIGVQLPKEYSLCAAGTNGQNYYAAAYREDGSCDVLSYNPNYGVWYRENSEKFIGFARSGGSLYGVTENALWEMKGGDGDTEWSFTTGRFTEDSFSHKGLNSMWLRLDAEDGCKIDVSVSSDDGAFVSCAEITGKGYGVHRVPVRFGKCDSFRIRLKGKGKAVIHNLEVISYQGGRTYAI